MDVIPCCQKVIDTDQPEWEMIAFRPLKVILPEICYLASAGKRIAAK